MAIIEFQKLIDKKEECNRVRKLLMEGKTPLDHYADAQARYIEALEDCSEKQDAYIAELKGYISDFEALNQAQDKLTKLLEGLKPQE